MDIANKPTWLDNQSYTARIDRMVVNSIIAKSGVCGAGDLEVLPQSTPNMSVQIYPGRAWIKGSQVKWQGTYQVVNDSIINLNVPTPDSSPRIDIIVARVYDSEYGDGLDTAQIELISGTPASSPVAPSVPPKAIKLAQFTVTPSMTAITAVNMVDSRANANLRADMNPNVWRNSTDWTLIPASSMDTNVVAFGSPYPAPKYRVNIDRIEFAGMFQVNQGFGPGYGGSETANKLLFRMPQELWPKTTKYSSCIVGKIAFFTDVVLGHYHGLYMASVEVLMQYNPAGEVRVYPGGLFTSGEYLSISRATFSLEKGQNWLS